LPVVPKPYQLSFIGTLVHKMGVPLGIDPAELLQIINGRAPASLAFRTGLAKELHSDAGLLDRLADEIRSDLAAK
jgi:hypothetical protein